MDWDAGGKKDAILAGSIVGGILGFVLVLFLGISLWNNVVKPRYHAWRERRNAANNATSLEEGRNAGATDRQHRARMVSEVFTAVNTVELPNYLPPSMPSSRTRYG